MMDQRNLKLAIQEAEQLKYNIVRAMNIRIKISQKRNEAIEMLSHDLGWLFSKKFENISLKRHGNLAGQTLLENCLKREERFLGYIEEGLKRVYKEQKASYRWIDENIEDKEARDKAKVLLETIAIFYSRLGDIYQRLRMERALIERLKEIPDIKSRESIKKHFDENERLFDEFVNQWKKEIELNRKLLKKVKKVFYKRNVEGTLRAQLELFKKAIKPAAIGAGLGFVSKTAFFVPENKTLLEATLIGALIGVAISLIDTLAKQEEIMEQIDIKELGRVRKQLRKI